MRLRLPVITLTLIAIVAACSKPGPVAKGANSVAPLPAVVHQVDASPAEAPPPDAAKASSAPAADGNEAIPASLQGRWGLTPQDCTTALGDAKGLLVINAGELRFYESRAVPTDARTDGAVYRGDFHFTGEGQSWTKFESLKRDGDRLIRTEGNPTASFTYAKC